MCGPRVRSTQRIQRKRQSPQTNDEGREHYLLLSQRHCFLLGFKNSVTPLWSIGFSTKVLYTSALTSRREEERHRQIRPYLLPRSFSVVLLISPRLLAAALRLCLLASYLPQCALHRRWIPFLSLWAAMQLSISPPPYTLSLLFPHINTPRQFSISVHVQHCYGFHLTPDSAAL